MQPTGTSTGSDLLHVYLDVDGVLNAMAHRTPAGYRTARAGHHNLAWNPAIITALTALTSRGDVQGVWLTDWEDDTADLCHLTGLDALDWPVLTGDHHFNTGSDWWKLTALQAHQQAHPTRFAWVDNDLPAEHDAVAWARATGRGACLGPWDQVGLNPGHLATLEQLATQNLPPAAVPAPKGWIQALTAGM